MTKREYNERMQYYVFHLISLPLIICIAIYFIGTVIETLFNLEMGVAKEIFVGIGGVGYFILYFKGFLPKIR